MKRAALVPSMQFIDWQVVRLISRLSILNRVAFTMLFVVPLIAGFLRPVRVSVDRANSVIDNAQSKTEDVQDVVEGAQALQKLGGRLRDELLGNEDVSDAAGAEPVIEPASPSRLSLMQGVLAWNIGTPWLPRPWAMAFWAALLILLSDTVFQVWCPEIVKSWSLDEYTDRQCSNYANHPSRSLVVDAKRETEGQEIHAELCEAEKRLLNDLQAGTADAQYLLLELQSVRTNLIECASRQLYLQSTARFVWAARVCAAAYLVAAVIILKILQEQAFNVISSAGWWSS